MATKQIDLEAFAKKYAIKIGARYRRFIETNEAEKYAGCAVWGLPYWSLDSKIGVRFLPPTLKPFEDNDVQRDDYPYFVALARLSGAADFLTVDAASPEAAVFYWNHEDGMFTELAPSLDAFLAGLLKRGDKTPYRLLVDSLKRARAALEKHQYREIQRALGDLPEAWATGEVPDDGRDKVGEYFNYQGLAHQGLGRRASAKEAFTRAVELDCSAAILNLMSMHLEDGEPAEAIALGKDAVFFDDEQVFWVMRYLVEAYLREGRLAEAEAELTALQKKFAVEDEAKVTEAKTWLEGFARDATGTVATDAKKLLPILGKLQATAETRGDLRQWWDDLPRYGAFWQPLFLEQVKAKKKPTDDQLARMMEIEHLRVEPDGSGEQTIDVTPLARLTKLEHVSFKGDVLSLEPLQALREDLSVWVNDEVIRGLRMPARADVALLRACERGDAAAIAAALDAGADPNAKTPQAQSGLHKLMLCFKLSWPKRTELAKLLIERGADPYVDDMHDKTPLAYVTPKVAKVLEKTYQATGRQSLSLPFRVWAPAEHRLGEGVCLLGRLEGKEDVRQALATGHLTVAMEKDYPGAKKDKRLVDFHEIPNYDRLGVVVISPRLRDFLQSNRLAEGVTFLPITIKNHAGKRVDTGHVVMHPQVLDCLDEERCQPSYRESWVTDASPPDRADFNEVRRMVVDAERVPEGIQIFRALHYSGPLVVRERAAELIAAQDFEGFGFTLLRR
ncbi:MAG: hypothetical protein JXR96_17885 [Deltaproteobacteria bacterium]|nr:hypothetical protein [Deltaproteobacteria bacterium]